MYEFIFQSKLATIAAGGVLLLMACALAARVSFWWRSLALNSGPVIAAGFMVAILLSDQRFSVVDVMAALTFEVAILAIFCRLAFLAYRSLHDIPQRTVTRSLAVATLLYGASLVPSALSSGFGIFSSGTRIDYLYESSSAKYLTYGGLMLSIVLGGLLARRITVNRRPRLMDYGVILVVSIASILAGSKGGFVLWIGAVLAFVDYRKARIRSRTILLALTGMAALVTLMAVVVSEFLRISVPEFFELAFSRFFLSNDARALAIDQRALQVNPAVSLSSEAFRSISSLFGNPPQNASLGVELYDRYFGPSGGAGANASFVALAMFYTAPDYAVMPLLCAAVAAFLLLLVFNVIAAHMPGIFSRFCVQIIATLNIALLSQDFLAFQVVMPMTVVIALLFYFSGSFHVIATRRPRLPAQ